MKDTILFWSIAVALAGFLFGFDVVVISGADKTLQQLWNTSDLFHGIIVMASALWGTVVGALLGGFPANVYGRKNTLIGIGVLYFVSAVGSALAHDPYSFAFFRFIGGLGIGASTIAAPAYISEISPAAKRGRLVAMYQLSIVLGILFAFFSNYLLQDTGQHDWRYMLGVAAFPALVYCILMFFIPDSPRWLASKGKTDAAMKVVKRIDAHADIHDFFSELKAESSSAHESIFMKRYRPALLLAFFIAFFNQFSGINAVLYYAPRIFEEAGLAERSAFLSSVGIGVMNVLCTLIGMNLIDRYGRKRLMYIGSVGYIISLGLVALFFSFVNGGIIFPLLIFIFIAAHAIGQGTVIWVFIAEIFPTHLRASGQAFGSSVHWILAAVIPSLIPYLFSTVGAAAVFAFFAVMMLGQLLWVKMKMPETKGKSLEEVSRNLSV
jgi:sugar porter (SP) family MFS transporter